MVKLLHGSNQRQVGKGWPAEREMKVGVRHATCTARSISALEQPFHHVWRAQGSHARAAGEISAGRDLALGWLLSAADSRVRRAQGSHARAAGEISVGRDLALCWLLDAADSSWHGRTRYTEKEEQPQGLTALTASTGPARPIKYGPATEDLQFKHTYADHRHKQS